MPKNKKPRKSTSVTVIGADGRKHKKTISYYTKIELTEKTEAFRREVNEVKKITLKTVAEDWKEQHDKEIEHYTSDCYAAPLKDVLAAFGTDALEDITPARIQVLLDSLDRKGFAKQTIKLRKIVLSLIFDFAILNGYTKTNPVTVCKIPKSAPKSTRDLPTDNDIKNIIASPDSPAKAFYLLLMYTGLRREEALALTPSDLDFKNCRLTVDKVVIFDNGKPVLRHSTKSAAGTRTAPFPEVLHKYFTGITTTYLYGDILPTKSQFEKFLKKYRDENAVTCTCHQLRHYFATNLYNMGADPLSMQRLMGHANYSTTAEIYTHIKQQQADSFITDYNSTVAESSKPSESSESGARIIQFPHKTANGTHTG